MLLHLRLTCTVLLLAAVFRASCQENYDEAMKTPVPTCEDVAYISSVLFTGFMEREQLDSARNILAYWEKKCGIREPLVRAKFILAFTENTPLDTLIDDRMLEHLANYSNRAVLLKEKNYVHYDWAKGYYGYVPLGQELDDYSRAFFTRQVPKHEPGTVHYLLSEFYSDSASSEMLYEQLKHEQYAGTRLGQLYLTEVNKYRNKPESNVAAFAGVWMPTGDIRRLGVHPQLGFQLGGEYKRMNLDATIAFKFLRAANTYYARRVKYDDSLVLTDKFFGGYIGLDFGYDIFRKKAHETQLLAGIGWDGFDVLDEDKARGIKAETVSALNLNLGIGHRYYINNSLYIALQAKYNMVNYTANGVVDFTGNPITIMFAVGGMGNQMKSSNLRYLRYDWR